MKALAFTFARSAMKRKKNETGSMAAADSSVWSAVDECTSTAPNDSPIDIAEIESDGHIAKSIRYEFKTMPKSFSPTLSSKQNAVLRGVSADNCDIATKAVRSNFGDGKVQTDDANTSNGDSEDRARPPPSLKTSNNEGTTDGTSMSMALTLQDATGSMDTSETDFLSLNDTTVNEKDDDDKRDDALAETRAMKDNHGKPITSAAITTTATAVTSPTTTNVDVTTISNDDLFVIDRLPDNDAGDTATQEKFNKNNEHLRNNMAVPLDSKVSASSTTDDCIARTKRHFTEPPFAMDEPSNPNDIREFDGKQWIAVHQCAKFCNNPKLLHEKAVKHIGQYLAGTANQGIILNPDSSGKLDAYVDSDFAGRWHQKFAELRESVLSRTGFVITYCNCPVTWSSKLQTEIALSTTEAEYIALSTMCRTLLPMRMLLKEINKHTVHKLQIDDSRLSTNLMNSTGEGKLIVSEVFEDNSGCVVLANDDQYTLAHMPRKMKIYM